MPLLPMLTSTQLLSHTSMRKLLLSPMLMPRLLLTLMPLLQSPLLPQLSTMPPTPMLPLPQLPTPDTTTDLPQLPMLLLQLLLLQLKNFTRGHVQTRHKLHSEKIPETCCVKL